MSASDLISNTVPAIIGGAVVVHTVDTVFGSRRSRSQSSRSSSSSSSRKPKSPQSKSGNKNQKGERTMAKRKKYYMRKVGNKRVRCKMPKKSRR